MLGLFKRNLLVGIILFFGISCSTESKETKTEKASAIGVSTKEKEIKYLALGDSYTIGTGLDSNDLNYPTQLAQRLNSESEISCREVRVIAENGWTTTDLIEAIKKEDLDATYSLVSLLIGVNNQYQGDSISVYISEFEELLTTALSLAANDTNHVFVISIPDYGVTPFGRQKAEQIEKEINYYNAINDSISNAFGISYFNITDISRNALNDESLLAPDSLHPSSTMYEQWIASFYSEVLQKVN